MTCCSPDHRVSNNIDLLMLSLAREQEAIFGIFCRGGLANDVFGAKINHLAMAPRDRRAIDSNTIMGTMMEASGFLYIYICTYASRCANGEQRGAWAACRVVRGALEIHGFGYA
jgi:hypothetical protein